MGYLSGRWLGRAGFAPGSVLAVQVEACRLVVTVSARPRPLTAAADCLRPAAKSLERPAQTTDPQLERESRQWLRSASGIDLIFLGGYSHLMSWEVEYTDEFERWWEALTDDEQVSVAAVVGILEDEGPHLGFPYSSGIASSRHRHMRELRVQHEGRPYRVLYAFDPRRVAILLLGGDKTGRDRWYEEAVPAADRLYEAHVASLKREGLT
jgi:hypothetical protein